MIKKIERNYIECAMIQTKNIHLKQVREYLENYLKSITFYGL